MPSKCYSLAGLGLSPRVTSWPTSPRSMPRGLKRQWQILRGVHISYTPVATTPKYRDAPLSGSSWGAKTATVNRKSPSSMQKLNSAILIPSSVNDTHPGAIINRIQPLSRQDAIRETFCVFLVTPSFAPWILNDDFFLTKAIRQAYCRAPSDLTIQALCAVVDKLPAGRAIAPGLSVHDVVAKRSIEPPVGESGFEGIAYTTLPTSASVPSTSPRSPDKGAIDFIQSGLTEGKTPYTDTWRLPLANTVFQTGSPTTMYYTNWRLCANHNTLTLQERKDVTHHGVEMTVPGTASTRISSVLSIPLVPLTFPRTVQGCMGNIIRRVVDDEGQSVTASSELEKVVPRFFKARGEPAQPTTAWALVMPGKKRKNRESKTRRMLAKNILKSEKGQNMHEVLWDRLWQSNPTQWSVIVSTAVAEGARLHRVLSGGGGWGKKAGLLSLDPVPVSDEVPIRMEDATSGFEGPGDFSTALTPVVHDGDAIQFFISPAPASGVDGDKALETLKNLPKEEALGWELGTIPSTVDSIPGGSWQHVGADSEYLAVFENSFGALSEGPITLTRHRAGSRDDPLLPFFTTTLDVPYSRLWSVELGDEEISNHDIKYCWQRESQELLHRLEKRDPKPPPPIRKIINMNAPVSRLPEAHHDEPVTIRHCPAIDKEVRIRRFVSKSGQENDTEVGLLIAGKKKEAAREKHHLDVPRRGKRELAFSEFLRRTSGTADESRRVVDGSLLDGFGAIRADIIRKRAKILARRMAAKFERQVENLIISTSALYKDLQAALAALDQLERITRATNQSAFDVYNIHISLRLRLLKMVRFHQRRADRPGRAHVRSRISLLESHIAKLRTFDKVLFAPSSKTNPQQIRTRLNEQEYQHPVQQYLTRRAWHQVARNITSASQQIAAGLRIRRHLTYAGESRARKTANIEQPHIRFQRQKPAPATRARIRRHYAWRPRLRRYESMRPRQSIRSRRVLSRESSGPRTRTKQELLQAVSSWLGDGPAEARVRKAARRAGRPFGSKMFGGGEEGSSEKREGGMARQEGDDGHDDIERGRI